MREMTVQQQTVDFERLSALIGPDLALYCLCAVYDLPFDPESEAETWADYAEEYQRRSFSEGNTDVNAAILAGMDAGERWSTIWGEGYSETDYKQLDDLYRTMTAQLDATGGIDRQQDDTARTCAMMALQRNKLIRSKNKDDIAMAKTFDQMIRENLKDANMRKADILPSGVQKLPTIVDILRKRLGLEMDMTKEQVFGAFYAWLQLKKYPFTLDAAEHIIMLILNLIQKNDDMQELYNAPDDMDFAPYAAEFEKEPNEAEKEAYEYGGYVRGEWNAGKERDD